MAVVALRSLKNGLKTGVGAYTPSDLFSVYAEDLNSIKATIGGGHLNPISLLTERYSLDTLSLFIQGIERMDGLGNCLLRETKPEADVVYNLGTAAFKWATVYAGNFVGSGAGITGLLRTDGTNAMLADLDFGGFAGVGLLDPVNPQDAATKAYVDAVGVVSFADLTSGTNAAAAMLVGTGASLAASGAGTIAATSCTGNSATASAVAFSGVTAATNAVALVVGTGGSLGVSGSGTIDATTLLGNTWAVPEPIGITTPNTGAFSFLTMSGGARLAFRSTAISTTATTADTIISVTAVPATITLMTAASAGDGFVLIVKDSSGAATGASRVIIDGSGAETIDGNLTAEIASAWGSYTIYSTGAAWRII